MPRETVKARELTSDSADADPRVSVGWKRDGFVQIGTATNGVAGLDGLFLDLDRDGINHLIRLLRKARDQAYGSDA